MYVIGGQVALSPKQLRLMFATFAALGIYLAVTAVAEKLNWTWAVYPKYIMDPKFAEFLGRGRGPLLNPAANGILLTLALSCGVMPVLWYRHIGRLSVLLTVARLFGRHLLHIDSQCLVSCRNGAVWNCACAGTDSLAIGAGNDCARLQFDDFDG